MRAERTIRDADEKLHAGCPVRVFTHIFGGPPSNGTAVTSGDILHAGTIHYADGVTDYPPHDHEHYEVGFVTAGAALHRTFTGEIRLEAGSCYIVAPGQVHGYPSFRGAHIVNCAYIPEWLLHDVTDVWGVERLIPLFFATGMVRDPSAGGVTLYRLDRVRMNACMRELQDIGREQDRPDRSLAYMRCCLEKVMVVLARALAEDLGAERAGLAMPQPVLHALRAIEAIISDNREFRVPAVAEEAGTSAAHFSQVFKEATGWTPMDYFQRRRVQRASWLLMHPGRSITEVAHSLGFCDAAHFCHQFKKHKGCSPRAYRKLFMRG